MIRVFLGPSLALKQARKILSADYQGPVQRGSVTQAVADGARDIVIIDGHFHTIPTVTHREILNAMDRGVRVMGAASIGALRAVELERFGMVGVGQVFESYRNGSITKEDEVAVTTGPAELGYPRLSEALVDIRATLDAWKLPSAIRSIILLLAGSLHYPDRNWRTIIQVAQQHGITISEPPELVSVKERDARSLLTKVAQELEAA